MTSWYFEMHIECFNMFPNHLVDYFDGHICDGCCSRTRTYVWPQICQIIPWTVWTCLVFVFLYPRIWGVMAIVFIKMTKGLALPWYPPYALFICSKLWGTFSWAWRAHDVLCLSADGRFGGFWRPSMRLVLLTVVVSQAFWERHHTSFTVEG